MLCVPIVVLLFLAAAHSRPARLERRRMSEPDDLVHLTPAELEILGPLIKALAEMACKQLKADEAAAANASATVSD